jgi:hypothetical protein
MLLIRILAAACLENLVLLLFSIGIATCLSLIVLGLLLSGTLFQSVHGSYCAQRRFIEHRITELHADCDDQPRKQSRHDGVATSVARFTQDAEHAGS